MYLYDKVYNRQTHLAADNFLEYSRKNYVGSQPEANSSG